VVPGPGGNAYERDSVGGRGGRHDRQRSVSARHTEHVGAAGRRLRGERAEVIARLEDDRVDPPFTRRLDKPRPSSPATAGPRIDEEHGLSRGVSAPPSDPQLMKPPAYSHAAPRVPRWADELDRLDAAVYAAIAVTPTPVMDVALRRLSRAANYSRLWLGCSALLGACGGKRGRRAAENGLASIALTSAVVNLVLKPLGNRRRPDRHRYDVPVTRQVAMPRSTSWPSGHSASAFAFASGVSAAWPQAGIPLSVVASLVAYSRVHTGVHYPSDTIAGTASGVALAPVAVAVLERRRSAGG
jgi:membrane-associated phospholipid phosphatase